MRVILLQKPNESIIKLINKSFRGNKTKSRLRILITILNSVFILYGYIVLLCVKIYTSLTGLRKPSLYSGSSLPNIA